MASSLNVSDTSNTTKQVNQLKDSRNGSITISISQVAPLIGLDNYGNFPKVVCEIWRKYNPSEFREFELRLKGEGHNLANASEFNDFWEVDELLGTNILEQVRNINLDKDKTSSQMLKSQSTISEYIQKQTGLTSEQKDSLITKVCSATNKSHGVCNEDAILSEFARLSGLTLQGTQGWVEIPLFSCRIEEAEPGAKWLVIGKYDAITTTGELVEAKMRQRGLFKKMRDYENVQVQLYLHALEYKTAFLVEGYSGKKSKDNKPEIYTHDVAYDADYVNEFILDRLRKFTEYFKEVMANDERKNEVLKGSKNEYTRYQEEYLGIESIEF